MHIDFGIKLQKIDSKIFENFRPQEIDWILNDTILKYVESNLVPKRELGIESPLQSTKARYDNIEELITTKSLPLYKNDDNSVYTTLPQNYFKLIDDISETIPTCTLADNTTEADSKHGYASIYVPKDKTDNDYKLIKITGSLTNGGDTILYDASTRYYSATGIPEETRYEFIRDVLNNLVGCEVYWEQYSNVTNNNSFIFVSDTIDYIRFQWNAEVNDDDIVYMTSSEHKTYTTSVKPKGNYSNRLVKSEYLTNYLNNSLLTTKIHTPVSNMEHGKLVVNHMGRFLPRNVKLIYIRKPAKVDSALKYNCDLNSNVHEKIVDLAVKRVSSAISSGNLAQLQEISKTVD